MKVLLLLLPLLLLSCTKEKASQDTLSIGLTGEVSSLDPAICYDGVCYVPVTQIYEPLFELEYLKSWYFQYDGSPPESNRSSSTVVQRAAGADWTIDVGADVSVAEPRMAQAEHVRNGGHPPEPRRHGHIQLCRHHVGEIVERQGGRVTEDSL